MQVISSREFRSNQRKYFGLAKDGEDVILKSRDCGSFRLVPVVAQDVVIGKPNLMERVRNALMEVKMIEKGQLKPKTLDELINEL